MGFWNEVTETFGLALHRSRSVLGDRCLQVATADALCSAVAAMTVVSCGRSGISKVCYLPQLLYGRIDRAVKSPILCLLRRLLRHVINLTLGDTVGIGRVFPASSRLMAAGAEYATADTIRQGTTD